MNVTIRHLRAALAVQKHENFRRAAEEVHLSQPALSLAVRELEKNLGVTLFDRTSRMVRTTDVGMSFLRNAERVLSDFDDLLHDIGDLARSRRGRVIVSSVASFAGRVLPIAMRLCDERFPEIEVSIRDEVAVRVADVVRFGEADFGVTVEGPDLDYDLEFDALFEEPFFVICTKAHPFARKTSVRWRDLSNENLVTLAMTSGSHRIIDEELVRADVHIQRPIQVSQLATVHGMLEAGVGISVLPELGLPSEHHASLVAVPLVDPVRTRKIGIIKRRDRSLSPAASAFAEIMREVLPDILGQPKTD